MKKTLYIIALVATSLVQNSFAKNPNKNLSELLTSYYGIKDGLVNSDSKATANKATAFTKAVNAVNMKTLSEKEHTAFMSIRGKLLADAQNISSATDIDKQRAYFKTLSDNLFVLAKDVKLSDQPIYQQFCPMKKSNWLSNETAIKNPYYGKQMLTCGKVSATLK